MYRDVVRVGDLFVSHAFGHRDQYFAFAIGEFVSFARRFRFAGAVVQRLPQFADDFAAVVVDVDAAVVLFLGFGVDETVHDGHESGLGQVFEVTVYGCPLLEIEHDGIYQYQIRLQQRGAFGEVGRVVEYPADFEFVAGFGQYGFQPGGDNGRRFYDGGFAAFFR